MNRALDQFKNPDEHAALSESLLKQGIAKTKLDADRMADGMLGKSQNVRPSGQRFHFGLDDKKSEAKIDNYSGPATLNYDEHEHNSHNEIYTATPEPAHNPHHIQVVDYTQTKQTHHDPFKTLSEQMARAESEIVEQRTVISKLQDEIHNLKQTHEVFHSKMEELHNKIDQEIPNQKPFVGDSAVHQLDTMMQQPFDMDAENRREEEDISFEREVYREVVEAEAPKTLSRDEEIIQRAQAQNPVPKQEVVDIDLGNIFR